MRKSWSTWCKFCYFFKIYFFGFLLNYNKWINFSLWQWIVTFNFKRFSFIITIWILLFSFNMLAAQSFFILILDALLLVFLFLSTCKLSSLIIFYLQIFYSISTYKLNHKFCREILLRRNYNVRIFFCIIKLNWARSGFSFFLFWKSGTQKNCW